MSGWLTPVPLTIVDRYADGEGALHFTFALPAGNEVPAVAPGQFFMLSLPGQGEAAFTYVTMPDSKGRFDALIRNVGSLTGALFEQSAQAHPPLLGHRGPYGRPFPLQDLRDGRVLVIAGGCGLAPLCAIIDHLAAARGARVALIYGARNERTQVLSAERARFAQRLPVFETFDHPDDPSHRRGFPLTCLQDAFGALGGEPDVALICGPQVMMTACATAMVDQGLVRERILLLLERRMHCAVGHCGHCFVGPTYVCKQGPTYSLAELEALDVPSARSPFR